MMAVCETFGVARSYMAQPVKQRPSKARGRPPLTNLADKIKAIISEMPTFGYRWLLAILRLKPRRENLLWPNAKRVYRLMKVHLTAATMVALLSLSRMRWCSDGFEIGCHNKEKVRVALRSTAVTARLLLMSPQLNIWVPISCGFTTKDSQQHP